MPTLQTRLGTLRAALPRYLTYQLVTKTIMSALVLPLFAGVTSWLASGRDVTNSNLVGFLLSPQGVGWLVCGLAVLLVGFVLEIAGFIVIAARALTGAGATSYRAILGLGLRRVPNLAGFGSLLVLAYVLVILPLSGGDAPISALTGVRLPPFVTDAIAASPALLGLTLGVSAVLTLAGAFLSYTFHFIVLADEPVGRAVRHSAVLVARQPGVYLTRFVGTVMLVGVLASLLVAVWWAGVLGLMTALGTESRRGQAVLILLLLVQQAGTLLVTMVAVPIQVHLLTDAFLVATEREERFRGLADRLPVLPATSPSRLDRVLRRTGLVALVGLVILAVLSIPAGNLFNDLFRAPGSARVVAHRAGGFAAPENSLPGLHAALAQGVWAVEIDVQRTRDGAYILNHDDTFARVAGDRRAASAMTLAEVRALDLSRARDGSVRVPTLEEFLVAARGRAHVIIELKGATADERMAEDVIALLDRLHMTDQAILMSLDYRLIARIETLHPNVETGYAFYFALGDVTGLVSDYVLLEEDQATPGRLMAVTAAGKKPVVWTVNSPDSIRRFATTPAYAIITDEPAAVTRAVRDRPQLTGIELVQEVLFGGG